MIIFCLLIPLLASSASQATTAVAPSNGEPCNFEFAKQVLIKTDFGYTAEWTIADDSELTAPLRMNEPTYSDIANWIHSQTTLDWKGILLNQIDIVEKKVVNVTGCGDCQKIIDSDRLVLAGLGGDVRPLSCLESIPYREFLNVVNLKKFPQEFNATIFRKANSVRIIGDFYILPSSEGVVAGAGETLVSSKEREKLIATGWIFYAHVHNHPFVFSNSYGDIGGEVCPSYPDIEAYRSLNPQFGVITNGIDTIWINRDQFMKY